MRFLSSAPESHFAHTSFGLLRSAFALLRPLVAAVLLSGLLLTGCAVPLGPGFRLRSRQMVLGETPAPSAPVRVRVADRMENTGNRPLAYLDVTLPAAIAAGRSNLTIRVDGRTVPPVPVSDAPGRPSAGSVRSALAATTATGSGSRIRLLDRSRPGGVAGATPEGFYLADPARPSFLAYAGRLLRQRRSPKP